ncbi:MAG: type II toxin-antitoxin system VapC family toxin [Candidatus Micrarchaeota archaeon]|nr:type II toxin-antitoxin system VapC family toxin [Candidatus Micrarchaeota archaeon]
MKLFLDSSAIIELFDNNSKVVKVIAEADELYTSVICAYEVLVGEKHHQIKGLRSYYEKAMRFFMDIPTLEVTHADAVLAADITAASISKGKAVDGFDFIIAAQALSRGTAVLTKNSKHFEMISAETGLQVEKIA